MPNFAKVIAVDRVEMPATPARTFVTTCRGFQSYLKPEMIEETMPNAFLGDQLIRLELLRGVPADYLMVQLPKIGWWLTPPDGGKLLLVDSECYASTYTSDPIQTQRIFEAVLEADCALFVCHQGGSHFMAGFIVRPAEALKPLDQREFQSMIVITDTLASSVNSIPNEPSDRLLEGLRLALEGSPAELFPVVKLLGPSQMAGNNCGIFTYLALLRFLQTPTMFDMPPGGDSLVSDETRRHVRTWSSPEIARQIRVQLHKDYSTFWKYKPPAVWSMRRQDDLNSLLDEPNWPQFLPDMLRLLDPTKGMNNLRSIHAGLFSPTILLDFLRTGGDISDVFADVLFRVHPTEPERIIAPCPFTLGDYNLNSHRHYNSHRFYHGLQEGDYSPVPYVESGAVRIITAVTKETEILFIPIFTVTGHFWSLWLDFPLRTIFFSDSLNNTNRLSDVETVREELVRVLAQSGIASARLVDLGDWPIKQVIVTCQVANECLLCVTDSFRSLSLFHKPMRPEECIPPRPVAYEPGWEERFRFQLFKELFSTR